MALVTLSCYYAWNRVNWTTWAPSDLLLEFQGLQRDRSTLELLRRFDAGTLSADQVIRMNENGLAVSLSLPERNPYPAGIPIYISISAVPQLPLRVLGIPDGPSHMDLFGTMTVKRTDNDEVVWQVYSLAPGPELLIPRLPPGTYSIEVSGDAILSNRYYDRAKYTWDISASSELFVTEQEVDEVTCMKVQFEDTLPLQARAFRYWTDFGLSPEIVITLRLVDPTFPVLGHIWVRGDTNQSYVRLSEPFIPALWGSEYDAVIPVVTISSETDETESLNIRIVPHAAMAVTANVGEYTCNVIEWDDVSVSTLDILHSPDNWVGPTRIREESEVGD